MLSVMDKFLWNLPFRLNFVLLEAVSKNLKKFKEFGCPKKNCISGYRISDTTARNNQIIAAKFPSHRFWDSVIIVNVITRVIDNNKFVYFHEKYNIYMLSVTDNGFPIRTQYVPKKEI